MRAEKQGLIPATTVGIFTIGCISIIELGGPTTTKALPIATWTKDAIIPVKSPDPENPNEFQCDLWFFFVS